MTVYELLCTLIAIGGLIIAGLTLFHTRKKDEVDSANDLSDWKIAEAEWRGNVNGKLDSILGIEPRVTKLEDDMGKVKSKVEFHDKSITRAHERMDKAFGGRDERKVM